MPGELKRHVGSGALTFAFIGESTLQVRLGLYTRISRRKIQTGCLRCLTVRSSARGRDKVPTSKCQQRLRSTRTLEITSGVRAAAHVFLLSTLATTASGRLQPAASDPKQTHVRCPGRRGNPSYVSS